MNDNWGKFIIKCDYYFLTDLLSRLISICKGYHELVSYFYTKPFDLRQKIIVSIYIFYFNVRLTR